MNSVVAHYLARLLLLRGDDAAAAITEVAKSTHKLNIMIHESAALMHMSINRWVKSQAGFVWSNPACLIPSYFQRPLPEPFTSSFIYRKDDHHAAGCLKYFAVLDVLGKSVWTSCDLH